LFQKSPFGPIAIGAFLLHAFFFAVFSAIPAANSHAGPFLTRDQNPFTLVYGQPLPTPARLPQAEEFNYALSLEITNSLNVESAVNESLYADFEAYNLTPGGIYGLSKRWALKLDIPFIYRGGGVFDHAIDEWHKLFSLPRASRPDVADDQFRLSYSNSGTTDINLNTSTAGIADVQLGLGRSLFQNSQHALSVWASIDVPVGDTSILTGNEDLDYSFWLAGSSKLGERSLFDTNFGVVLPGDSVLKSLETENLVFFGHAGAHIALNPTFALKLQLAGHSGYYQDTTLDFLGSALILVFGGSINTGGCSAIDIGFSEDIKVGASPDIGLLISWKSQFNDCN
jgi:hypothetical protein